MRALLLAGLLVAGTAAQAATIQVGPERSIKLPSKAAAEANDGDVIQIDEGEYYDCLRLRTDGVTVEGTGGGAVLSDTTCDGKAIVVVGADRIVLRNLTLQRARVGDGNGAGVRAEGINLTIEKLRFKNDQAGILIASDPGANVIIRDSQFTDTGRCEGQRCSAAISAGAIRSLRVERTLISGTVGAHQIVSQARRTDLIADVIEDGAKGSASFQVLLPAGGSLVMEDCVIQKGPRAANTRAAILLDGGPAGPIAFRRNRFVNETGQKVPFILDWSDTTPLLEGNVVAAADSEISTSGLITHRLAGDARDFKQAARGAVGAVLRAVRRLVP